LGRRKVAVEKKLRILNSREIEQILSMPDVIQLVEKAFGESGRKQVQMPPKSYLYFSRFNGDLRIMPAYLEELNKVGVKMVNAHPDNPSKFGLPTVMGSIMLFDPETGVPVSLMDGTYITAMRTAAASAVAAKYLARKDSKVLAVIGAGYQSFRQVEALREVLKLKSVRIFDIDSEKTEKLAILLYDRFGITAKQVAGAEEAVRGSDVLVTVTPSRKPIVMSEWVVEGMHISAVGADAPGKEELEPALLKRARIVIDDWEQGSHGGEINVPLSNGTIGKSDIYADIGEIVAGIKQGRVSDKEITIFDTTGLAIQDVITAWHAYEIAEKKGIGVEFSPLYS
jgi:alanine dehydrogenase